MFISGVNAACINGLFSWPTLQGVHPSFERLLTYAQKQTATSSQPVLTDADLARAMNESPQVVGNWQRRGLSATGALNAQRLFKCSATWLLDGVGEVSAPPVDSRPAALQDEEPESAAALLEKMGMLLSTVPPPVRGAFADVLRGWAEAGGADGRREALLALLGSSGKRQANGA